MDNIQSFGKWLRHRRRELDLTQDELARQVGCAPITIRKIEGDEMRPSKQLAESLSGPLGIPVNQREDFVRFARAETKEALSDHFASLFEITDPSTVSESSLPSGTVHLLFSDIGGSTQLVQRLGEDYVRVSCGMHLLNGMGMKSARMVTLFLRFSLGPRMLFLPP